MIEFALPLLGFCAFSGTGKTTLLIKLLPILKQQGLRIGMIKHAHHQFDIDHPNKDSYRLREAGASQMMIASNRYKAWICECEDDFEEASLEDTLSVLQIDKLDLVLVEGFKYESFPKIEIHRPDLGKPLMFPDDPDIIAVATDAPLPVDTRGLQILDLNKTQEIADFILYNFLSTDSNLLQKKKSL